MWVVLAACQRPTLPAPHVDRAEPSFAWSGESTAIRILGRGFYPLLDVAADGSGADVNPSYEARLVGPTDAGIAGAVGAEALLGVAILDAGTLTATVPAGLPPGTWDLVVESPAGQRAVLGDGFLVTNQEAAQLSLVPEDTVLPAGTSTAVALELLDLEGKRVGVPIEVTVTAAHEVPDAVVSVLPGTFVVEDDVPGGLRGLLPTGAGTVFVTADTPGVLTLALSATDPASTIVADERAIAFTPGGELVVRLDRDLGVAVAGQAFALRATLGDQYGNPVPDRVEVALRTTCSGWSGRFDLAGETVLAVTPRIASTPACPQDQVEVTEPATLATSTAPYLVVPGSPEGLEVVVSQPAVRAGESAVVLVYARDAFGNRAEWTGDLTLSDSLGGLADQACSTVPKEQIRVCEVTLTRAGAAVVVSAVGDDGLLGQSGPITVLPGLVPEALTTELAGPIVAGAPHPVRVAVRDAWGNVLDGSAFPDLAVTDERGDAVCVRLGEGADGAGAFSCTLTAARDAAILTGSSAALGLASDGPDVEVVNGPLAAVRIEAPAAATAGEPVPITVAGEDAFGNPYRVQADRDVALDDAAGSLVPVVATLDRRGEAEVDAVFEGAGVVVVRASQLGVTLGTSEPVRVAAGAPIGLRLTTPPWAWTDAPAAVLVEAVDAWGNRALHTGPATLASRTTAAPAVALALADGAGEAEFLWSSTARPDTLDAAADALVGSREVVVVQTCANGPVAALAFAGAAEGAACDSGDGSGALVADLSASARGQRPLEDWLASVDDAAPISDAGGLPVVTLVGFGRHAVRGLVVDAAGCASEARADAWLGRDDGTPTGTLLVDSPAVDVGVNDVVNIEIVGARDCAGDPAAGARVGVRTDAGTLDATPTGAGLALDLDAAGDGLLSLTTAGGISGPEVTVLAWAAETARGELRLPLDGDAVRPVVIAASPVGAGDAVVDTFVVRFSEPLLPDTVTPDLFLVGLAPAAAVALDGDTVTVTASTPVDGAAGSVDLTAGTGLRDLAGNRLAGAWGASAAPWTSAYGGADAAPAPPSCDAFAPAGLAFRPDGDPGEGLEAEAFEVTVSAVSSPAWWVLEVADPVGEPIAEAWAAATGPSAALAWDGRGFDGRIVPPGAYRVAVSADDGRGNRSASCGASVTLALAP